MFCFSLKLAQSYFFPFVYFRAKNNHLLQIIHLFLQIVNIFLSIVCKPKRFLFCMFLFVVKWWEIPLEGSLVACKWRAIRWLLVQDLSWLFSVKFNICKVFLNRGYIPFDYHHEKLNRLSQLVRQRWETLPSAFPRDESHFTILKLDLHPPFWKIFHSLRNKHSKDWTRTSQ